MAASPPPSAATADEFVPDLHLIPREHDNLLSQVPQQGLDFLGSATFYKAMVEAAREANTLLLFNVENKDAVTEFRRFLTLKILVRDTMADQISPTPLMDAVWHQLILNTQVYEELQTRIGLKLHHRPSGASDAEAGMCPSQAYDGGVSKNTDRTYRILDI
ncbi:hypothetical protein HYFRA_00007335 [Hymenoscyphus fraxineus]|uniref:Uncharacterized protein n=1 Tax=Hymenoscyphus fraxineus TaxID=746836 RepID=A0A9N9KSP0_9HELO|nr:hypothetical protein HYFRA_00007335 [Hymenoscyphus fraxineus]